MKAAPPLVFPSSRVLAGWWRQLAPRNPESLLVGHLLLHHVDALVLTARRTPLDPLARFVLRALARTPLSLVDLEERLHIGKQLLGRILSELTSADLVQADRGERWIATSAGASAAAEGEARRSHVERRSFHFRDVSPAAFVPLEGSLCQPVTPPPGWAFDPATLQRCAAESADWQQRHGFPSDVRAVLSPDDADEPPTWQRIIIDRAEHMVLALAVEAGQLRGFSVEPRGWLLNAARPAMALGPAWPEVFPEAAHGPSAESWRNAWRAGANHSVPLTEAEACALTREGAALRIQAPRELLGRLHSGNGESARDEIWLLAGEGTLRTAARVELLPPST